VPAVGEQVEIDPADQRELGVAEQEVVDRRALRKRRGAAASIMADGPVSPKNRDIRPAMADTWLPITMVGSSVPASWEYSSFVSPT
jgi:hypothetical protein